MKLLPTETSLVGKWLKIGQQLIADDVSIRIEVLTQIHLKPLGRDVSGWDSLFLDPNDGRLWELIYPDSHTHAGGAPELRNIDFFNASQKYGEIVSKINQR